MQYKEPDNWNQPEECAPHYDSDGDALNCMECNQKECENYDRWHD
jgi:hypothetical protein